MFTCPAVRPYFRVSSHLYSQLKYHTLGNFRGLLGLEFVAKSIHPFRPPSVTHISNHIYAPHGSLIQHLEQRNGFVHGVKN